MHSDSIANLNSNDSKQMNRDRDALNSVSSLQSASGSGSSAPVPSPTTAVADNTFHEFEKVRVDYLRRGKVYEDTVFLPTDTSAYYSAQPPMQLEWIRAKVSM